MYQHIFAPQSYLATLFASFRGLVHAQEILRPSNIRIGYLRYFFAFPLALIFINIQDCLLASNLRVLGFPAITVTFISFAVGAATVKFSASIKNIHILSKASAVLLLMGFIPWLFLPDGYPSFICALVFMTGVGCCVAIGGFSFVFILNNTERFFGCVLMSFFIGFVKNNAELLRLYPPIRISLITALIAGISVCIYTTKSRDFSNADERSFQGFDPSVWLALFVVLSYFTIRILGFYVPEFQIWLPPSVGSLLAFVPPMLCVVLQVAFKRSVWTMCNVFFLSAIMSYIMAFAGMPDIAYIFSGIKETGLFVSFYLLTCVCNKFCNFRKVKIISSICVLSIGAVFVVPDILINTALTHTVAVSVSFGLFIVFLLMSPTFAQYLFSADWSQDFAKLYMTEIEAQVDMAQTDDLNLSQREKAELFTPEELDIAILLIEGETQRDISRKLHRPAADVNQQLKNIRDKVIRKLSVENARNGDMDFTASFERYHLTAREREICVMLLGAHSLKQIAAELRVAYSTVNKHCTNLYRKLGVNSRAELFQIFSVLTNWSPED